MDQGSRAYRAARAVVGQHRPQTISHTQHTSGLVFLAPGTCASHAHKVQSCCRDAAAVAHSRNQYAHVGHAAAGAHRVQRAPEYLSSTGQARGCTEMHLLDMLLRALTKCRELQGTSALGGRHGPWASDRLYHLHASGILHLEPVCAQPSTTGSQGAGNTRAPELWGAGSGHGLQDVADEDAQVLPLGPRDVPRQGGNPQGGSFPTGLEGCDAGRQLPQQLVQHLSHLQQACRE